MLRSGRLSLGPTIDRFEELVRRARRARRTRPRSRAAPPGSTCSRRIAGVGPGDEVITSPFSFVASANCFIFEGATPVFADVDPRTLNLDPRAVEAAVTERTKAIVAVDIFGYPCELDELRAIADRHGLALIDDACEALGAEYKGAPVGSHGARAVFAFYPNKQIDDRRGRRRHDALRRGGEAAPEPPQPGTLVRDAAGSTTSRLGFNYRFDRPPGGDRDRPAREARRDPRAARGRGRALRRAARRRRRRRAAARGRRGPRALVVRLRRASSPPGIDRDARDRASLRRRASRRGHYVPCVHLQPTCASATASREGICPVAEDAASRTLALPFFPQLEAEDQERVVDALSDASRSVCARIIAAWSTAAHGLPRIRQVRPRRQDLRARAAARVTSAAAGARTRVWVEGIPEPIVASRTERTILADMGRTPRAGSQLIDDGARSRRTPRCSSRDTAASTSATSSRRARRLLESTPEPARDRTALLNGSSRPSRAERPGRRSARLSPHRRRHRRRCARRRPFRRLWFGTGISAIGSQITTVAIPFQVYDGDGLDAARRTARDRGARPAADGAARTPAPSRTPSTAAACCSSPTSRWPRRRPSAWSLNALLPATRACRSSSSPRPPSTAAYAFQRPARNALTPRLVRDDQLTAAIAVEDVVFNLARVAGPALAGLLIAFVRPRRRVRGRPRARSPPRSSRSGCCRASRGVRTPSRRACARSSRASGYVRHEPALLGIFLVDTIAMIFGMPSALFPAFGEELGGGAGDGRPPVRGAVRRARSSPRSSRAG